MAELADALASGASDSNIVQVQPLSRAPNPDFLKNLRAHARFLLPSEARSKGENGLAVRGSRAHFRPPFHHYGKFLVWGFGLY